MPHVVLVGDTRIEEVFERLEPMMIKDGGTLLKTTARYLESGGSSILVESLAIEDGSKTAFFTLIGRRDDGLVVRLHPMSDVEKTVGVKRVLAGTARAIMAAHDGFTVGKTNLQDLL